MTINEPSAGRLSKKGLARLHDSMVAHVAPGRLPGLVTLVASGDDVHVDTIGSPSFADEVPLARDAIFRIASLTKPIVAAAAMSLVDEGRLRLDEPIDDLVPELADRRVLRSIDAELDDTVAARRPITLDDLLTSRLGFGSVMVPPDTYPIQRAEEAARLQSIGGPPWPPGPHDVDSWIAALGALPLMYQPGDQWLYGTSSQVLGIVVARAAGADLGSVLRSRLFEPLGMRDTGFSVPADQLGRLTTLYVPDADTGEPSVLDDPADSWWSTPPRLPDAGGWLVSTIDDYWSFVSMLLAGGTGRDGTRVLSSATVELMTTDHLTAAQRDAVFGGYGSWGFGVLVPAPGAADQPLPHGIGWDGGTGVTWRSNPWTGVTGILFTQRHVLAPTPSQLVQDFWAGVNAAATP
jgi:CubicO group peptidase (beta-lactamase class C family)